MFVLCKSEGWRNAGPRDLARGGCLCHAHAEARLSVRDTLPRGAGLQRAARLRSAGARRGRAPLVSQFEGAEEAVWLLCPFPQLLGINWGLPPLESPGVSHPRSSAQEGSGLWGGGIPPGMYVEHGRVLPAPCHTEHQLHTGAMHGREPGLCTRVGSESVPPAQNQPSRSLRPRCHGGAQMGVTGVGRDGAGALPSCAGSCGADAVAPVVSS